MRGIPIPDREEDFTADAGELFFDLVYVFAFSQLVSYLVHHPTWSGAGRFALLLVMIWMPWSQFTWSANAVAGNSRPVRLLFLVATVASVPMAGSVTGALDVGGPAFALSLSVILLIGLATMISGVGDEPVVRAAILRYSVPNLVAVVIMTGGAFLDGDARMAAWIGAMTVIVAGTVRAGSSEWLIRPGHFAERHGLIVIIALGEVIVALGQPVAAGVEEGAGIAGGSLVALVGAGLFAGLLWWSYFDRPHPAIEHHHHGIEGGRARGRFARDVYTWAHFPLVAGVVLATAGLEAITVHPFEPLTTPARLQLFGGLSLFLLAVAAAVIRAFRSVAVERVVAVGALAAVIGVSGRLDGIVVLALVDLVLALMLVVEHLRVERWSRTIPVPSVTGRAGGRIG